MLQFSNTIPKILQSNLPANNEIYPRLNHLIGSHNSPPLSFQLQSLGIILIY